MDHPDYELIETRLGEPSIHMDRVVPVYPLTESLPQRTLRRILWNTVGQYGGMAVDLLPAGTSFVSGASVRVDMCQSSVRSRARGALVRRVLAHGWMVTVARAAMVRTTPVF